MHKAASHTKGVQGSTEIFLDQILLARFRFFFPRNFINGTPPHVSLCHAATGITHFRLVLTLVVVAALLLFRHHKPTRP